MKHVVNGIAKAWKVETITPNAIVERDIQAKARNGRLLKVERETVHRSGYIVVEDNPCDLIRTSHAEIGLLDLDALDSIWLLWSEYDGGVSTWISGFDELTAEEQREIQDPSQAEWETGGWGKVLFHGPLRITEVSAESPYAPIDGGNAVFLEPGNSTG